MPQRTTRLSKEKMRITRLLPVIPVRAQVVMATHDPPPKVLGILLRKLMFLSSLGLLPNSFLGLRRARQPRPTFHLLRSAKPRTKLLPLQQKNSKSFPPSDMSGI